MSQSVYTDVGGSKMYNMSVTAVMTAVTCILAPMSVPIGPVPISLTNLVIFLSLYLLGWKKGMLSYLMYMLIGMIGVPVFSGYAGGVGKLLGSTGGYIIGFIPMAGIAGFVVEKFNHRMFHFIAMLMGTVVCYSFGTVWFCAVMESTIAVALGTCVSPFILGDVAKIFLAIMIGPRLRNRLRRARILN